MKTLRPTRITVLAMVPVLFIAGCGGESEQTADDADGALASSREELIELAKSEGTLRALTSFEFTEELEDAFEKAYPEIDVEIEEVAGTDENQRLILELEAGQAGESDVLLLHADRYNEVVPFVAELDLGALGEAGVVNIPPEMIDPESGSVAAFASQVGCLAYNPQLLDPEDYPETWEDLLDETLSGGKMFVDVRPNNMAPLFVEWGEESVLEYAEELAAQEPIWARGQTDQITQVAAGLTPVHAFCQYDAAYKVQQRERQEALEIVLPEPIPVRLSEALGVQKDAEHPNAALLFLDFMASAEGQEVLNLDYKTSIYAPGSLNSEIIEGKETSVSTIEHFATQGDWNSKIVETFGFPQPEAE